MVCNSARSRQTALIAALPVVVMTAFGTVRTAVEAMKSGGASD